nr:Ig-like domain-containing protein [Lachnospiraceae bacterium]
MQYKGFKRIRRAAAIILSAALITSELPQTGIAYAAETDGYEIQAAAEQGTFQEEQEGSVPDSSEQQTIESDSTEPQDSANESHETQPGTELAVETEHEPEAGTSDTVEIETKVETETSDTTETDSASESSIPETSENGGSETASEHEDETASAETVETETVGTEDSTDLETSESEMITLEEEATEEENSVPVPDVDASVYSAKTTKNVSAFRMIAPKAYASVQDPVEITANEYRIENRDQYFGFLSGKSDYDGCTVTLACNIDMKSETAYFGGRFSGTFDGNGYSIQNLKVDQGLFPVIQSGAVVKNLHISNASMTGEYSAGIIAGRNDGTITNCVVTGKLEASNKMEYTAGIVGVNEGNIENCVFAGNITAAANTADAEKDIGGIAGRNNGVIQSCYAVGSINTKAAVVAGIAGTNTSRQSESIKDCANYMSVEGAYIVAGIVGINESEVADCTNYGAVRQKNNSQEIGEAGGIAAQNKIGTIRDCYNYANINGEDKNIGGIAATTSGAITGCGNYGSVTGLANVGGIVGLYNGNREYSISECFNQGNINGNGRTNKSLGIGGILGSTGESYKVPIENCYNTGNIRATNVTQYLGGIAGVIYKGSISNCYNAGNVVGEKSSYAAMLVGFFGKEEDTFCANCLYVGDEHAIAFYREDGGVSDIEMAKTSSDLRSQDVLAILGGSFSSDYGSYMNNGYPILNGQTKPSYRYLVVYELNGGYSSSIYYELINQDSSVNKPDDPTKNYAAFQGWYTDAGLNVSYNFGAQIKAPVILYAKWKSDTIVEDIELLQTSLEMMIGEEYTIKVRYTPEKPQNAEMVWDSSNTSVVTVDEKGTIKAAAAGKATITGKLKDNSLSKVLELKVTVTDEDNIIHIRRVDDGVELSDLDIAVKETVTLEAVTYGFSNNATIQWGPGKDDYVKITPKTDSLGTPKAVVEGLKPTPSGSPVKVKFTVMDGDIISSQSVNVTVLPLATGVKVKLDEEDVTEKTVIYDLVTKKFIAVGTKKLKKPVEA